MVEYTAPLNTDADIQALKVGDTFTAEVNPVYGPRLQRVTEVKGWNEDQSVYQITAVDAEWSKQSESLLKYL